MKAQDKERKIEELSSLTFPDLSNPNFLNVRKASCMPDSPVQGNARGATWIYDVLVNKKKMDVRSFRL